MQYFEANFDGLIGPTHNYAGLSVGNVASLQNANEVSKPREAVKQGLLKMKALHGLGFKQGILPPQERPDVKTLRSLGFSGKNDGEVVQSAHKVAPHILAACYSASSMWTANAATVSPSPDSKDNKVHFTPANLCSKFHRSIESETTSKALKAIFVGDKYFAHHNPLVPGDHFSDEGAANHTRFCEDYSSEGVEFFVFGRYGFDENQTKPKKFPARQTLEASEAIARLHQLRPEKTVFAQQNPEVIDQGVFHNDVISVGNRNLLFYHEQAFLNSNKMIEDIQTAYGSKEFHFLKAPDKLVSVKDAVTSYLFNSQLLSKAENDMVLVAPEECRSNERVWAYIQSLIEEKNPINQVQIMDVKQSMKNGGGPACLRLRVVLSEEELDAVNPSCLMSDSVFQRLNEWADKHYREELSIEDLADPQLIVESRSALDELTQILKLGPIYPFQN